MLTGYCRIAQDGIEPLKENTFMQKDPNGSHYFFDHMRFALQHELNKKELLSGMGILAFAPNGSLWFQTGEYCYELNELASYYFVMDTVLEEAKKCQAKTVEIFIPNEKIVRQMNKKNPYSDDIYKQIHCQTKEKFSQFQKVIISFRNKYPKDVQTRLDKESVQASQPPQISTSGHWTNQVGSKLYFNVGQTEEDMKKFAEQYARICYNFMESYIKEYEQDYGKDALHKLFKDLKEKKIKKLPPTKRVLKERKELVSIKNTNPPVFKKSILCHHCDGVMMFESAELEKPYNTKKYKMRCAKCLATKTSDDKGRLIAYGRYPKKKI